MVIIPSFLMPINKQVHAFRGILCSYGKEWGVSMYLSSIFYHIGDLSILVMESGKNKCRIPFL